MPVHFPSSTIGCYRIIDPNLGSGSFGTVALAEDPVTRTPVAIKCVPDSEWDESEYRSLASLAHPNILRLRDYYFQSGKHYLVTDYARGGDLFDFLEGKARIEENVVRPLFYQLASAISFVHASGFAHRDLKLENIFLSQDHLSAILGDWGFATRWSRNSLLKERCGTLSYLAPEMIDGSGYFGPEVDMWSLGVLLYYLLVGVLPFDGSCDSDTEALILQAQPYIPAFLSAQAALLLRSLLCLAKQRVTSSEILSHPWFMKAPVESAVAPPSPLADDCGDNLFSLSKSQKRPQYSTTDLSHSPKRSRTPDAPDMMLAPFSLFDSLPFPPSATSSSSSSPSLFESVSALPFCSIDDDFLPNAFHLHPDSVY
ncbi:MAG: protein kinase [archaeon]|nr:protein kinase [archaeon]